VFHQSVGFQARNAKAVDLIFRKNARLLCTSSRWSPPHHQFFPNTLPQSQSTQISQGKGSIESLRRKRENRVSCWADILRECVGSEGKGSIESLQRIG
jgi:hypothetical protein